ncbi:TonB-dependent receptor [Massilia litorea]|uniref:TonB-dependent receptor n=1 Tax=Massilia litorea TaxID=2769491 RepID=A0A7L9U507_9BURK|nr:TonB-dependent receptor [Massilia litorea]QOL49930.1 TonB-dependent receptor [Massilia litorea]
MITQQQIRLTKLALALSIALSAVPTFAQNTTSAIGGRVSSADGAPAAGAQVSIVHTESGSVSNVVTDAQGRYVARGLRVGGPYTIIITKNGVSEKRENVYVQLAETASIDATLGAAAMQTVTVTGTANRSERFNRTSMGAVTSIGATELATQASIQRNLQDYARSDPRVSQTDKERGEMSVAGQNSRYNSITVDGVAINDTFGLESNGSPTARQPLSIEAIQSVQVNVANYDVTQKGYTGANVNAVTKSGTNTWKGGAYYVYRDDSMSGKRYNNVADTYSDVPKFKEDTKGLWASGPLIEDKLFIYALTEKSKSTRAIPDFGIVGSSAGTIVPITASAVASAQQIAKDVYGIDVGSIATTGGELTSEEQLLKVDWNISDDHRANFRYGKTKQTEPIFPSFSATGVTLDSMYYRNNKKIETAVAQVFSDWTPTFSTEARISMRDYDAIPDNNSRLPSIGLSFSGPLPAGTPSGTQTGSRFINFGTENSRQRNILGTKTMDYFAGANWTLGAHEVKFGLDYSKNEVYNAFLQNIYGNYTFACDNTLNASVCSKSGVTTAEIEAAVLSNFRNGKPTSYTLQTAAPGSSLDNAVADFTMNNTGLFVQDTWTINKQLTVSAGVRVDETGVGGTPLRNSAAAAPVIAGTGQFGRQTGGFGYDNTVTVDGQKLWQPRVGFNYKFDRALPTQIRGGAGLFQGAAATVWMSNPFSNPGVATRIINCSGTSSNRCPTDRSIFSFNPDAQPTNVGSPPAANVDILDPSLKQPSIWKANLAFDTELPWGGIVFGAEYLYTNNKSSIYYEHLNLGAPTATGSDGRQMFWNAAGLAAASYSANNGTVSTKSGITTTSRARNNQAFADVLLAKNSSKGDGNLITLSLSRPLTKGLGWSVAYTRTDATEVSPLTSSVSNSNFRARSVFNPNEEVAANSAYLVKDRVNALVNFQQKFIGTYNTRIGVFYEGRSGKPYSWTYKNDLNGDGVAGNDLMYIPKAPGSGEVAFYGATDAERAATEARFWDIVNSQSDLRDAAGGVVGRNKSFSKWTNTVDLRLSQEIPGIFKRNKATFTLDFLNFGNLLNKKWGHIEEVPFASAGGNVRGFVDYAGLDAQGRYVYAVRNKADDVTIKQQKNESQWAIQATLKYEF